METKLECLKPVFGITSKQVYNSEDNALMIARCPDGFKNKEIRDKCEQRNGTALEDHVPVSDIDGTATFANKHCAECHLIPTDNVLKWQVRVECHGSIFNFQSTDTILADITETKDCYLDFQPLVPHHHKKCFEGISMCNVTGKWQHYDNFTERACQLYKAPFQQYNNPFCAICNGLDIDRLTELTMAECSGGRRPQIGFVSFSALISMDSAAKHSLAEGTVRRKAIRIRDYCSEKQIYDAYTVSHNVVEDKVLIYWPSIFHRCSV